MSICFNVHAIDEQFGPRLTLTRCALLLVPSIAHLLFIGHLFGQGYDWYIALLPVFFMLLSFFSIPNIHRLNQLLLLGYSMEWLHSTYQDVARTLFLGQGMEVTTIIMGVIGLWSFCSLFVFNTRILATYYPRKGYC